MTARVNGSQQRYASPTRARTMPMMIMVVGKVDGRASHHHGATLRIPLRVVCEPILGLTCAHAAC
jgi:hypothetical protein